ncbi:MAG: hypothetical protein U1E65_00480 [Myxococcota bacterium]
MQRLIGVSALSVLALCPALARGDCKSGQDCVREAEAAIQEGALERAFGLAERAAALDPKERAPLEIAAAIADALGDLPAARRVYPRLRALPPAARTAPRAAPTPAATLSRGQLAFAGAARVWLRDRPNGRGVFQLRLNAPLRVLEAAQDGWARTEVLLGTRTTTSARPNPSGFVAIAYLSPKPVRLEETLARAAEAEKSSDLSELATQLERATLLAPGDWTLRRRLMQAALRAGLYPLAVGAAMQKTSGGHALLTAPRAPLKALAVRYLEEPVELESTARENRSYQLRLVGRVESKGPYQGWGVVHELSEYIDGCKSAPPPIPVPVLMRGNSIVRLPALQFDPLAGEGGAEVEHTFGKHVRSDTTVTIPELEVPVRLSGPQPGQTLRLDQALVKETPPDSPVVFVDPLLGPIREARAFRTEASAKPRTPSGFFARRKDGVTLLYEHQPVLSFQDVVWADGTRPTREYSFEAVDGLYQTIVDQSEVAASRLRSVGEVASTHQQVFALNSPQDPELTTLFREYATRTPTASRAQFDRDHPVVFAFDAFRRLIRYRNPKYTSPFMAEPIIYLYPERPQRVRVRVHGNEITASCPDPGADWTVQAEPGGQLTTLDGRRVRSLFWEGNAMNYPQPAQGFVVPEEQVVGLLLRVLPDLGLEGQEISDFLEAWAPSLRGAPWYFITFVDAAEIDRVAPLEVEPRPETVIRVLMEYQALARPQAVEPLRLPAPPVRRGFTLVEWGGVVRR